jgi:hypothetical protein
MNKRFFIVALFLALLVVATGIAQAASLLSSDRPALVYVKFTSPGDTSRFASTGLPVYATLDGGLLSGASESEQQALQKAGLAVQVLDPELRPGSYYLARTWSSRAAPDYFSYGQVLLDLGSSVVLHMPPSQVEALTRAGAEVSAITLTPKVLPTVENKEVNPAAVEPDPTIDLIISQVMTSEVSTYDRQLAGELPVWVDNDWYTITTRNTNSGTPIQKTTSFVGQHMANDLGLGVDYYVWDDNTNPDVIGEIPGLINPDKVFIIGAHIDDVNGTPGADDNASGSVATLIAADLMSQYQWGCTLRFAFWTGEEQGLLGSASYAEHVKSEGQNILGYLNLDMIAWNTPNSAQTIYLGYREGVPGSHELALLFDGVVDAYGLPLIPAIGTADDGASDHSSFLDQGYAAVLAIEGADDFNPYYHGPQDTPTHTDLNYFTNFVKASIATYAHMSGCLIPSGLGTLDGHVADADGGAPIAGARVTANDGQGHVASSVTDASGYYTRTLLASTYAVTAEAYGFSPSTIDGVVITTDTLTTQDFALTALPTYVVSGYVYDSVSGAPLISTLQFTDAPVPPVNTGPDGFYSITVAQGTWHLRAAALSHLPQTKELIVNENVTLDFYLDPKPCILLVDDDADDPDVRSSYTTPLDDLGYEYNVWNVAAVGNPAVSDLEGYRQVIWFTGFAYSNSFNDDNEAAVSSYLDAGGNFFLSAQDYLYDMGLTPFGLNYLHILNYSNDVNQTSVTGQNIYDGLGTYNLSYPFNNYSDRVNSDTESQVAFLGNQGTAAISYADPAFKTVFFGYPFEAIASLADRTDVMRRTVSFLGGCEPSAHVSISPPSQEKTGELGTQVSFIYTVTNDSPMEQEVLLSLTSIWPTESPTTTGVLGAGSSTSIPVTVTIPSTPGVIIDKDSFTLQARGSLGGYASATGTTFANASPSGEVFAPVGKSGKPLDVVIYEFEVTNTGNYTDSFSLAVSSDWSAALPGGENTSPLAVGASTTVTVRVTIPADVSNGDENVTTLTLTSDLDPAVTASGEVVTTVLILPPKLNVLLPLVRR